MLTPRWLLRTNENIHPHKILCKMFIAALFIVAKNWKQQKYPPIGEWIKISVPNKEGKKRGSHFWWKQQDKFFKNEHLKEARYKNNIYDITLSKSSLCMIQTSLQWYKSELWSSTGWYVQGTFCRDWNSLCLEWDVVCMCAYICKHSLIYTFKIYTFYPRQILS